jgi:hypothetical protein
MSKSNDSYRFSSRGNNNFRLSLFLLLLGFFSLSLLIFFFLFLELQCLLFFTELLLNELLLPLVNKLIESATVLELEILINDVPAYKTNTFARISKAAYSSL